MVSVCDEELLGSTVSDEGLGIEFRVGEPFYGGDLVDLDEALDLIRRSTSANLVGNRIVAAAIESGLARPEGILLIGGVKHAQIYLYEGEL